MKNRLTLMLVVELLELLHAHTTSDELRAFVSLLVFERLQLIINYFVEYDLDTKGVTNFAYFMEEEFKEKFEG